MSSNKLQSELDIYDTGSKSTFPSVNAALSQQVPAVLLDSMHSLAAVVQNSWEIRVWPVGLRLPHLCGSPGTWQYFHWEILAVPSGIANKSQTDIFARSKCFPISYFVKRSVVLELNHPLKSKWDCFSKHLNISLVAFILTCLAWSIGLLIFPSIRIYYRLALSL